MMSINGLVNAGPGSVGLGPGAGPGGAGMMAGSLAAGAHLGSGNNIEKISELLFNLSAIEVRDDFEEKMIAAYMYVKNILANKSESQANEEFIKLIGSSPVNNQNQNLIHNQISFGMLVSILLEPANTQRYFRDMIHISRDAMSSFIVNYIYIANEKYFRLQEQVRKQMVRLLREMVISKLSQLDNVFYSMFRNTVCGDVTPSNLYLTESLLDILIEFQQHLDKELLALALYNYLRLFLDHYAPHQRELRAKEANFCASLLRTRFHDFIFIGRDLVRLLQQAAVFPEFANIWKDMIHNPTNLARDFTGFVELMKIHTPARFIRLKLTLEMEKKIIFLTTHVRMANTKHYQSWLHRSYFTSTESTMLRCDWIRFINLIIHPTNSILSSDVTPRWALIGWLLSGFFQGNSVQPLKHALFYDWYFFEEKDNIMDIEPAMLTMWFCLKSYPLTSEQLLEFICRVPTTFHASTMPLVIYELQHQPQLFLPTVPPPGQQLIIVQQGLSGTTTTTVSQASVIQPNLNILTDGNTLANFSDDEDDPREPSPSKKLKKSNSFNGSSGKVAEPKSSLNAPPSMSSNNSLEYISNIIHNSVQSNSASHGNGTPNSVTVNDASNGATANHLSVPQEQPHQRSICGNSALSRDELREQIEQFSKVEIRACLQKIFHEKNRTVRCQEINKLAKLVLNDDADEFEEYSTSLTIILLALLEDDMSIRIFPLDFTRSGSQTPDDKELKDSITGPLFVMFRILAESIEDDQSSHNTLLTLLASMGTNNSKVGYLLFYFLIVSDYMSGRMSIYRSYARDMSKEIAESLLTDLRCCAYDDVYMFFYLLPEVFSNFSSSFVTTHFTDLLKMIVHHIDPLQVQVLLEKIISSSIKLLRKEAVIPILTASLDWGSHEQLFTWQIVLAHHISADQVIPILAKLEHSEHSEALSHLVLFIQREQPTANLIKHLFNRVSKPGDNFTVSILIHWAQSHAEKLAELIGNFVSTKISSPNKRNKRTQNNSSKSQVSIPTNIEQILYYLDEMRKMSKNNNFFTLEFMTIVLDQLRQFCSASQKAKYQELFTNVPDDNDSSKNSSSASSSSTNNKKVSSGSANNKKNQPLSKTRSGNTVNSSNKNNDSETESDSSDEEVPLTKSKAPPRKKRKTAFGSDSD
ncbi:Integrator complex subunit 3 [Tyrophagus putrescentiae]|nr:Integrator complex subunit 3 [Tyrophagus putrescentiae]